MERKPSISRRSVVAGGGLGLAMLMARSSSGHASPTEEVAFAADSRASLDQHPATLEADSAIKPFSIEVPKDDLVDLSRRLELTRWPNRELVNDQSQGIQLSTIKSIVGYWREQYDWRIIENRLNQLPQFVTEIDGVEIHFIHVRSAQRDALPLIVTHGWPGSIIEQIKIIGPLTDPLNHGATASDAFDIVIPSLPGHGFSGKPKLVGWDPARIARAWVVLMQRLGYKRYVAQGGDWGNAVTEQMALLQPPGLVAIHTNMPATIPPDIAKALEPGGSRPSGLLEEEMRAFDQLANFYKHGLGYAIEMSNRPQTLNALADSPAGLAAWMIDHDASSAAMIARVFDGGSEGLTRDDILDNITLYWLTNTAVSSARLYWENKLAFFEPKKVAIPVAVSVFPEEIYAAPLRWTQAAYSKLIYFNKLDRGGHFAAWEQPSLFCKELRAGFKSVRNGI